MDITSRTAPARMFVQSMPGYSTEKLTSDDALCVPACHAEDRNDKNITGSVGNSNSRTQPTNKSTDEQASELVQSLDDEGVIPTQVAPVQLIAQTAPEHNADEFTNDETVDIAACATGGKKDESINETHAGRTVSVKPPNQSTGELASEIVPALKHLDRPQEQPSKPDFNTLPVELRMMIFESLLADRGPLVMHLMPRRADWDCGESRDRVLLEAIGPEGLPYERYSLADDARLLAKRLLHICLSINKLSREVALRALILISPKAGIEITPFYMNPNTDILYIDGGNDLINSSNGRVHSTGKAGYGLPEMLRDPSFDTVKHIAWNADFAEAVCASHQEENAWFWDILPGMESVFKVEYDYVEVDFGAGLRNNDPVRGYVASGRHRAVKFMLTRPPASLIELGSRLLREWDTDAPDPAMPIAWDPQYPGFREGVDEVAVSFTVWMPEW